MVLIIFFDFEVFCKDWLMVAINPMTSTEHIICNDREKLKKFYEANKDDIWVGYNCRNYDQYILKAILCGFDPKKVNDWIIEKDRKGWEYSKLFHKIPLIIYDVMPNPPVGLKTLEAFMGKNIHETSVSFTIQRKLTQKEIDETIEYCRFDVLNTIEVFMRRRSEFDAHMGIIKAFDLPLRHLSKTQAQLAAVILDAKKQVFNDEWEIRLPDNLQLGKYQFVGDWFLDKANHSYKRIEYTKRGKEKEVKTHLTCQIAGLEHVVAWGGIHAGDVINVKCQDDEVIFDVDAGQLYPNIMRHYKLLSRAARKPEMLEYVLDTSMRLKAEGKKKEREPYKRQCNIFYGGMGDPTNPLYDPLHRNLVCVYGQVLIVDLLDKIEDLIELLNSNTDGIYFKVKKVNIPELNRRVALWEERTKLKMEFDEFKTFISKDVNNYLAVAANGKVKGKGAFVKEQSDLDYDLPIINQAIRDYLLLGISVEDTVYACRDLRKFQKVVKLSNKYEWVEHENGQRNIKFVNKAYRTFASRDNSDGQLMACRLKNGKLERKKFGGTADKCFIYNGDLTGVEIPTKLDHEWYINTAKERIAMFIN